MVPKHTSVTMRPDEPSGLHLGNFFVVIFFSDAVEVEAARVE
tara:strand:- start:1775 stop:1900 length:126 start_codon:yes stop_codon:yes gene_type:complete